MSVTQAVTKELPFLRRFARAVKGDQQLGDQSVAEAIRRATNDTKLAPTGSLKLTLFRALSSVLRDDLAREPEGDGSSQTLRADEVLSGLDPLARMYFLLVSVEGFAANDAGDILGLSVDEREETEQQGKRSLADQLSTDVMIIEDEPLIALELEDLVQELGHRLVGVARTREEAVKIAARNLPKLCLADIQLADNSSGIDAVNDILADMQIPVIFITAFPERFLTGQRPEPAFLISKPFDRDAVQAQISQALFFDHKAQRSV